MENGYDEEDEVYDLKMKVKMQSDCISELEAALAKYRWIPVRERLPELDDNGIQSVWVWATDGKEVVNAYYYDYTKREAKPGYATGKGWYCHGMSSRSITHWREIDLPE